MKACFKLYRDIKSAHPSIKTFLHIFYHCIKPIALCGSENWGTINITPKRKELSLYEIFKDWEFEKLNLKFNKYILGVSKLCTNIAVLSELGRYPLYIDILKHMFMYWHRLEQTPSDLLAKAFNEYKSNQHQQNNDWYSNILFFSKKLNIDLNICKNLSPYKFKIQLKK